MSYLEIRNVTLSYGATPVLRDISLDIDEGEMHVLLGPSGCGKTTLLRSIAGLSQAQSGSISLQGRRIDGLHPKDRDVAMVFQNYALFPNMTVTENLAFGLEQKGLPKAEIATKVESALRMVALTDRAGARPHQLSGGQKQRVALARALVLEPKILLLDEPLSALDAQIRKRLRDELRRIQREIGLTAILVTHDQEEAIALGTRVSVMDAGRLSQVGTPEEVYYRPANLFVARFMGDMNILEPAAVGALFGVAAERHWVLHPQMLTLLADASVAPAQGGLRVEGRLVDSKLQGQTVRHLVEAGGVELKLDQLYDPSAMRLMPGQPVTVAVSREHVHEVAG
jgi:putative spermidine/putrescine transport system ATP-binding protein